ncbi:HEAT repeat domain-containing protein [bacterium]|nr:HEAT repeat domain-containing protein [bacterium]
MGKKPLLVLLVVVVLFYCLFQTTTVVAKKDELGIVIAKIVKVLKYGGMTEKPDAVVALGMIGDSRAVEPLIEYLEHSEDDHLRCDIVTALGRIGDKKATPALIKALLNDSYCHVRCEAAEALGKLGNKKAIPALEKALKDEHYFVRADAADALKKITGKDYTYEGPKESPLKEIEEMMKKIKKTEKELLKQK